MNATEDKQRRAATLAEYVEVDTSDERVSRLWDRVSTELETNTQLETHSLKHGQWEASELRGWGMRWSGRIALASLAVAAVVGLTIGGQHWWENREEASGTGAITALEHATLETSSDRLAVDLEDGSRMELAAHSRLSVQKQVRDELRLKLDQGRVECDVAHNPKRQFYVQAAGVVVRVTGTRFSVDVKDEREHKSGETAHLVEVNVSRGSVEIQRLDGTMPIRRLTAGERWAMRVSDGLSTASVDTDSPGSSTSEKHSRSAVSAAQLNGNRVAAKTLPDEPPTEDARTLLEKGRVARRQHNPKAAAAAYQQLLTQYPQDSRAGLAAFELGRLRMDRLGDLKGAASALNQAIQSAPSSNVREDAMARLVEVYHRLGNPQTCENAKQSYLAAYPAGVHAATVRLRCD